MDAALLKVGLETGITMPVRVLAELWGKDERTLNTWAREGQIVGAYKHPNGEWWFFPNLLKEPPKEDINDNCESEGDRNDRNDQGTILRTVEGGRKRHVRTGARLPRRSGT